MYHADLIGGIAGKISGNTNVIWSIRNSNLGKKTSWKTKLILKLCILFSGILPKLIISCSKNSAALHANLGYPSKKITVISNGFDLEKIKPSEIEREKVRKSFDEGGPAKPIDINDYLELGIKLSTLSQAERDAIAFMYKKMLEAEKK